MEYYGKGGSINTAHIAELTDVFTFAEQAEEIVIPRPNFDPLSCLEENHPNRHV